MPCFSTYFLTDFAFIDQDLEQVYKFALGMRDIPYHSSQLVDPHQVASPNTWFCSYSSKIRQSFNTNERHA